MKNPILTTEELLAAVKTYAMGNYNRLGWDIVVEAYEDEQITALFGKTRTARGAIKKVYDDFKHYAAHRAEVQAEIF